MTVVTRQQLEDASVDAQTLEDFVNGSASPGTLVSRLGTDLKTVAKIIEEISAVLPAKPYTTLAALLADNAPAINTLAYALDTDEFYVKTGASTWTKSAQTRIEKAEENIEDILDIKKVEVKKQAVGAIGIDAFLNTGWSNADALEVFTLASWSPGANNKYISCPTNNNVTPYLRTVEQSRDQEVSTYMRLGTIYLRLRDDKALFFTINANIDQVEIGVVKGLESGSPTSIQLYAFNYLTAIQAVDPGFSRDVTENIVFTFGVEGFDFYFKYNGVEIKRWKDYAWLQSKAGKIAVKSLVNPYGYRNLDAQFFPDKELHSDTENLKFDLRDFGLKDLKATGSIPAASNTLTLNQNPGFKVGDTVIVEIGNEEGRGNPGTVGVGGTWPALSYADEATMNADLSKPNAQIAWNEENGRVYQYVSSSSTWFIRGLSPWYVYRVVPLSLIAKITAIADNVLTLDTPSVAAAEYATVYYANTKKMTDFVLGDVYTEDSGTAYHEWLPEKAIIEIPKGRFAFSNIVNFKTANRNGWTLQGKGAKVTEVFSPKGVASMSIAASNMTGIVIRDFTIRGNARKVGFGFSDVVMRVAQSSQTIFPSASGYPLGVTLNGCTNGYVCDIDSYDIWQGHVSISYCTDTKAERINARMTDGLMQYIQWLLMISDSTRGGFQDCTIESPIMTAALETFRSTGSVFKDIRILNGGISCNSSGDWLMEDISIRLQAGTWPTNGSWSINNPLMNINSNIQPPDASMLLGGTVRRYRVIQEGVLDELTYNPFCIIVNADNPNITIEGTYDGFQTWHPDICQGPDAQPSGGSQRGTVLINSTGENTIVRNCRVKGKAPSLYGGFANIHCTGAGAQIIDNVVDDIVAPTGTISGNRTNAAYGTGP